MSKSPDTSNPQDFDISALIRTLRQADPSDVADTITAAAASLSGSDLVLYVADFEQQVLEPLPDRSTHQELPGHEEINTTMAGRAFLLRKGVTTERVDGIRVWVPIVEGSDVTGVLAMTVPTMDDFTLGKCEELGVLAGFALAIQSRVTDLYGLHRRRKAMTLAASMQWDLLPPLTLETRRVAVAAMLEPAYEVGGDCFDYALNGTFLDFAFMDSMGHGLRSALLAALAIGAYRRDRRESRALDYIHCDIDAVVSEIHNGTSFLTGQLGRLNVDTGLLLWTNAGHPPPLLVRHGQVIRTLAGTPTLPWGFGPSDCTVYSEQLEPGDSVVLYTDGITTGRKDGEEFGEERLADLVSRHASDHLPIPLIVRHIVSAVLEYHDGKLSDDATVLILQWPAPNGESTAS